MVRRFVKPKEFNIGKHFSEHVHGMFLHPKPTINKVVREGIVPKDTLVPLLIILVGAFMTTIGESIWPIIITLDLWTALGYTAWFFVKLVLNPIILIFAWLVWVGIFHFLGSIVSGKDISNLDILHRTLKLVGLAMVPLFFNIFPFLPLLTGYWIWVLCLWAMAANYGTSVKGAFVITLPMLFITVLGTIGTFGLL